MKQLMTKQSSTVFFLLTILTLFATYSTGYTQAIDPPLSERTPQVRNAIVAAVPDVDNANDVTAAHLAAITVLDCSDKSISSLKSGDFNGLTALITLYLNKNSISDISVLKNLTSLTTLDLEKNSISDISILKNLTSLTALNLSHNSINDISVLENLTLLKWLYLSHNFSSDVSVDISVLEDLTSLEMLWLGGNSISDISVLKDLTSLKMLWLGNNSISDISVLENLTSLTSLWLSANSISDVSALEGLISLVSLTLDGNPILDLGPLRRLKKANPDVSIDIDISNRVPVFADGDQTTRSIAENTASGTNIGDAIAATDADNDTLTYSLSGTDAEAFRIVSTSGQLQTNDELDYETKDTYTVTVSVSDGNGGSDTIEVTINVTDANDAPTFAEGTSTTRTIAENTVSGTSIGNALTATDVDGDTLTYTLSGTDAAAFSIVSTSGQLQTNAELDYETKASYAVKVSVSDGNGGSDTVEVTINVTDANDAPIFTEGTSTTRTIAENTASGTNIGAFLEAADADKDTLTYSLSGTDAEAFSIVSTYGQLQTNAGLDYETKDTYTVTVSVSDGKGGSDTIEVTINVTDINEAPTFTDGSSTTLTIAENTASGTSIGNALTATDVDGDTLTYTLDGTDAAAFSIVSTSGQIQTNAELDYETKASYAVKVSVSDGKGGSDTIEVTINVTDINEAPTFTDGSSTTLTIAENTASGTNIGNAVAATDADGDTLTYSLSGTDAAAFSIVSTSGQIQTNAELDYETKASYSVTVSVSDGNGGTDSIEVTINVVLSISQRTQQVQDAIVAAITEVNAADDVTEAHLAEITSLDLSQKRITSLKSGDFDGLTALTTLRLSNNSLTALPSGVFDELTALTTLGLGSNSLSTLPSGVFDELTALTTLKLNANNISDMSELEDLTSLTTLYLVGNPISDYGPIRRLAAAIRAAGRSLILDINIAPEFTDGTSTTRTVVENTASGQDIGNAVAATDANGDTLTYTLGGTDAAAFSIVSTSGQIQTNATLDYETKTSYTVSVSVSDGNSGTDAIEVTINVTDILNDITPVNQRTQQVQDAIVAAITEVNAADDVTEAHLAEITSLNLSQKRITSLKSDDFDGLTALTTLRLELNSLTALPADIFDELTALTRLKLTGNSLTALPAGVFDELTTLTTLDVESNSLTALPSGVFDELTALTTLGLSNNSLTALPSGVFDELTALTTLGLSNNSLTALPAGIFDELTALTSFGLTDNNISDMSELEDLTSLVILYLAENPISDYGPIRRLAAAIRAAGRSLILDINIAPEFTDGTSTTRTVAENTVSGTNIGNAVAATDANGDTLTYTLGGTDAAAFSIVSTSGQIQTKVTLDYETKTSYTVSVSVSDGNSGTDSIEVTINVTDILNDITPVNQRTQQVQDAIVAAITEVNAADDVTEAHLAEITSLNLSQKRITSLKSDDFDGLTALTTLRLELNSLTALPADIFNELTALTRLKLTGNSLTALPSGVFDELTTLTTLDVEGNSLTALPSGVFDELTALTTLGLSNNSLTALPSGVFDELTALTTLGLSNNSLTALPAGIFDELTALTSFGLGSNSLSTLPSGVFDELTALTSLDLTDNNISDMSELEDLTSLVILYLAENPISDYGPIRRLAAAIRAAGRSLIFDINIAPEFTDGTSTTRTVAENTVSGTNIGNAVAATDANGDTLTYTLGGTDAAAFSIVSTSGQIQTKVTLDYETKTSYTVSVSVSDGNSGTDSIEVTINVTDANDAPMFNADDGTTFTIAENTASGTDIGSPLSATDADNDTLSYSLSGTDAAAFSIVSTSGQIQTNAALDYETKASYSVTVSVSDSNGGSDTIDITINVTDVNDAPVFNADDGTTFTIAENTASGTDIGSPLSATDADNDTLTYSLSETDAVVFSIVSTSGQIQTKAELDYETKASYSVTVSVSDSNGGSDTIEVTINVTDVNDAPTFTEGTSTTRTVAENTDSGTSIGTAVTATDADGNTLTYTLSGTDVSSFSIVSTSGQLKTSAALNYEAKAFYAVTVSVSDGNGGSDTIEVTINVTDVNDAPTFTEGTSTTRTVAENTASDTSIGTAVAATDTDGDTLTYTLDGPDAAAFSIVSTSGQLKTSAALNYEAKTSYAVTVSVSDGKGGTDSIEVTINVTDANDAPIFTDGSSTTRTIAENTASGQDIGNAVVATDVDNDTLIYTLGGTDAAAFRIVNASGQIQTKATLDYETKTSYAVTVSVSDGNGGTDSIEVTINVTDIVNDLTPVNQRTQQVQAAIVAAITDVDSADDVTEAHLAEITSLDLRRKRIASLKSVDFDGLTALTTLRLSNNSVTDLPVDIFAELTALTTLHLANNSLTALPPDIFDELTALTRLDLANNSLTALPSDIFDELTALTRLHLDDNSLTALPAGVFDELRALTRLHLANNSLTALPSDIFDELTALTTLDLANNSLTALPADIFDELRALTTLHLANNSISDISELEGLISLTTLSLAENPISDYEPLRRLIAAIEADGRSLTLDITIPDAPAAPSVQGSSVIPDNTVLLTNFPNPFNPETWIPYQLSEPAEVTLTIYDIRGRVVRTLLLGHQPAGFYQSRSKAAHWDGRNQFGEKVATGVYFYTLKAGNYTATRKLLIRK